MKKLRNLLLVLLSLVSVLAGVVGLAACGDKTPKVEISDEYEAVYEQYKAAVGDESAKSLEDWYADLTASITEVNQGEVNAVSVVEVNAAQFIRLDFANGKIYLTSLEAGGVH